MSTEGQPKARPGPWHDPHEGGLPSADELFGRTGPALSYPEIAAEVRHQAGLSDRPARYRGDMPDVGALRDELDL